MPGDLTDHYDPTAKVLRLSDSTYASPSVAALGVVAHEVGHAVQDATAYVPMRLRQGLVPVAGFGSNLGYLLFFAGLVMQATALAVVGLALFSSAALFALVTLPVEFNASRRALALLQDTRLLASGEAPLAKEVLDAAALTYVAGFAQALSQVFYFLHLLLAQRAHSEE
ncbi:MAG: Putative membrane protease YugP [uncultured Chloroflexi bacterium]|uniref:Membrane protease YugP n=1 Tax=uncultured Chloroflexota bacterium TaxID=166587 RepID=A0A6J4HT77_9CHLR|nr:MAG: Putative membrane protease YugP [uncultured Chloroflexota bacterium]